MKVRKWNGSSWVQDYPEVNVTSIVATGTPSTSTFLRGDGSWATPTATVSTTSGVGTYDGEDLTNAGFQQYDGTLNEALEALDTAIGSAGGGGETEWEFVGVGESTYTVSLNITEMNFDLYDYKVVVNAHQDTEVTSSTYYPYLQFLDETGAIISTSSYSSSLVGVYSNSETSSTSNVEYNFLDRYESKIRLGITPTSPETANDDTGFFGEFIIAPIFKYYSSASSYDGYGFMLSGQSVMSQGMNTVAQYEQGSTTNVYAHSQAMVSGSFIPDAPDQDRPDGIRVYWYGCDDLVVRIYRRQNRT